MGLRQVCIYRFISTMYTRLKNRITKDEKKVNKPLCDEIEKRFSYPNWLTGVFFYLFRNYTGKGWNLTSFFLVGKFNFFFFRIHWIPCRFSFISIRGGSCCTGEMIPKTLLRHSLWLSWNQKQFQIIFHCRYHCISTHAQNLLMTNSHQFPFLNKKKRILSHKLCA